MKIHNLCTETIILSVKSRTYAVGVEKSLARLSNSHLPTSALIELLVIVWWYLEMQLSMNLEWILRKHKSLRKQDLEIPSWNTTQTVKTLRAVCTVNRNKGSWFIYTRKFYFLGWLDSLSVLVPWQLVTKLRTHSQANRELPSQRIYTTKLRSKEAYASIHCMCLTAHFQLYISVNFSL